MGLLGGGEESLAATSGWGVLPPINSSADWGSSSNAGGGSSSVGSNSSTNHWNSGGSSSSSGGLVGSGGAAAASSSSVSSSGAPVSSNSSIGSNCTVVGQQRQNTNNAASSLGAHNSASNAATVDQLSSSPKPSSSWAQAAGKGLVNTNASSSSSNATSVNGPSSNINSHDAAAGIGQQQQQCSSQSSSMMGSGSTLATNANLNGGLVGVGASSLHATNANSSSNNASCSNTSSSSAFQCSSSNSTGGLIGGSGSSNPIDAAGVNKQRAGPPGPGQISDLIGQLSDDFRETLLTEKWGASVINQDSPWNLPPSPQSSPKTSSDTSTWRCPVNSGTEIWENTVRQKKGSMGSSSASLSSSSAMGAGGSGPSAQPWGQAPTTHIGGTWGEEEDVTNHWTGVPQSSSLNSVGGVGVGMGGNGAGPSGLAGVPGPSGLSSLSGGCVNSSSINNNWSAAPGLSNGGGNGSAISSYSLLNSGGIGGAGGPLGASSLGGPLGGAPGGVGGPDGPNSWNGNNDKSAFESRSKPTSWGNFDQSDSVSESNWEKSLGGGGNGSGNGGGSGNDSSFGTWNAPDMKKSEAGWDRESSDSMKGGVDDGTACWGNPVRNTHVGGGGGGRPQSWKDQQQQQKYGNNNNNGNKNGFNNGGWNNGNGNGGNKSANQSMLTRTWTETQGHRKSPSMWNDDAKSLNGNLTPNNWSDGQIDTSSWGASKPTKPLTREMILSSKQFRLLIDLGFKKDDAENALRNCQMRFEDALNELESNKPFKSSAFANPMNPLSVNKMQPPPPNRAPLPMLNAQSGPAGGNSASIHHLVQRIQLAVSTGFLNPQILNQPLSNQNLEIISELLQQIKHLKEVQMSLSVPSLNPALKSQMEYKVNQIKQTIRDLQNQLRNEASPGVGGPNKPMGMQSSNDFFSSKSNNDLYGLANDYSSGGAGPGGPQGSRLLSWKSYNKQQSNEDKMMNPLGGDFIRAPGGIQKQNSNWSNFMGDDSGWPSDMNKHDKGDLSGAGGLDEYSLSSNFAVQDTYDSYKSTWKPTAKSGLVDDDPRSPISQNAMLKDSMFSWNSVGAGSNAGSKANNSLLGGGNGQSQMDSLNSFGFGGGSSNPWSYNSGNGAGGGQSGNNSAQMFADMNKKPSMGKSSTWSNQGLGSDYSDSLWNPQGANNGVAGGGNNNNGNSVAGGKPRPPPGLSKNSNPSSSNSIWTPGLSSSNSSEYLRLRNLTPQIDGSTLKTLCLQHGPLHLFHLFLNHGTAIARYSNRDQAIKAQSALNNCVLGNTTILADLPAEPEVQQYLQLINGGGHSSNLANGGSSNGANNGHNGGGTNSHGNQQSGQSAAQQQSGSHHQQHHAHHSQAYNSSWSNGTSQSTAGAGAVSASVAQSSQSQHHPSSNSLYSRTSSVGSAPNGNASMAAHFGGNSFSVQQPTTSPASTLPYGGGSAAGAPGMVTTHSPSSLPYPSNVLNAHASAASAAVAASQFNQKMDNGLLSGWNTNSGGSSGLWDSSPLGAGGSAGLWSTAGFSAADRNTPIQNFLPGDLLAGENN